MNLFITAFIFVIFSFSASAQIGEHEFPTGKDYNELLELVKEIQSKVDKLITVKQVESPILSTLNKGGDLDVFGVSELKKFAKDNGLSNSGNKATVIERILKWFSKELKDKKTK